MSLEYGPQGQETHLVRQWAGGWILWDKDAPLVALNPIDRKWFDPVHQQWKVRPWDIEVRDGQST